MEPLNLKSKIFFCRIIKAMKGKPFLQLKAKGFLPLTIELLGDGIYTPFGKAHNYSFCNYYMQNGDLMQVPEMCFLFIDNRKTNDSDNMDQVTILPYMFQYAEISHYECSIQFTPNKVVGVKERMQLKHKFLAELWLTEIESVNYLKS